MTFLNGIRTILFDLDGTLRLTLPRGADFFADFAASKGIYIDSSARCTALRWEAYYWAESIDLKADLKENAIETTAFWVNYSRRQLIALGYNPVHGNEMAEEAQAYMREHFKPKMVLADGLIPLLEALVEVGISLAVVSNRDKAFDDELNELEIAKYFAFTVAAGEVGSWKPDAGIFIHALKQSGYPASEAMYVGDNYFADVLGAKNAGITPILYDPRAIFDEPGCITVTSFGLLKKLFFVE